MQAFLLLALSASSALAALSSNGEPIKLAAVKHRNLGEASFNSLFARQTLTCPLGSNDCADGLGCCHLTETCCLTGCCPFQYTCDPDGEGTASQPCVCFGFGCPDPVDDDDDDSVSSTTTRSTTSASSTSTTAAAVTTSTDDDVETATTSPTAIATTDSDDDSASSTPETSATHATSTDSAVETESAVGGGSGGGTTGAGAQVSAMGGFAVMLLAGSIGLAAVAL